MLFRRRAMRSQRSKAKGVNKSKAAHKAKKGIEKSKRVEKSKRLDKSTKAKKHHHHHHHHTRGSGSSALDEKNLAKLQKSLAEHQKSRIDTSSPIVMLHVGREGRLFAAHEHVLRQSPFLDGACDNFPPKQEVRKIALHEEEPEVFSAVLEFLYTGDYYPRLMHDKRHKKWELEDKVVFSSTTAAQPSARPDATVFLSSEGAAILRDTVIYCAAERYGLEGLKRLALRKQGLQSGVDAATTLRSAQYAYAHTPDSDSRLRAHYLALIVRCRKTFKRSGTMQAEMEAGGSGLFFDLFVAMCDHIDDVMDVTSSRGRLPK